MGEQRTIHFNDRKEREEFIINEIGLGEPVDEFIVDKHHPNGPEIHTLTDTGIIIVRNERTKKLVTLLIARPGQIRRYYIGKENEIPKGLLDIAYKHYIEGYNNK